MTIVRAERAADLDAIRRVNEEAFGREVEAHIVERLRKRGALTVSLVAVENGEVVGHIAFSPVTIESGPSSFEAMGLGPIAVLPAHQGKGVGSQLVRAGLDECRRLGYEVVFLVGHAEYYPRFGFVRARPRGIECEVEVPDDAWMVLELREGALAGWQGTARFQREFAEGSG